MCTTTRLRNFFQNLSRLYEDRERFVKHVKSQPLERFGVHKTARDLFEDRRLRPLPLVSRTDTDSQNEEEKEKKDVEEKVSTEDVDLDGNPLKRHPSLPNIPLAVTASSSLCLVSTGFVEAYKIHVADKTFYNSTTYMTFYVFEFFWYFLKKKEKNENTEPNKASCTLHISCQ